MQSFELEPPTELQGIIDKTASFVARLGLDFEKRVKENERGNPKFSFLVVGDPYYAYYQRKINEFKIEAGIPIQPTTEPQIPLPPPAAPANQEIISEVAVEEPPKRGATSLSQRIITIARKLKTNEIEYKPTPELFISELPPDITAIDYDIMRLTAQFVARNGHQFQVGLMTREHRNPQFDFLKPGHSSNAFFSSLVESYTRCLLPPKGLNERLKEEFSAKQPLLDRLIVRYQVQKQKEDEEAAKQREEAQNVAAIDWHDFVVVETIDFFDEVAPSQSSANNNNNNNNQNAPQAADMDMDDMEMEVDEPAAPKKPAEIRIRRDYVKGAAPAESTKYQICPKCGQEIPVDEMENHMRIELLDPKYRQQRQTQMERNKITTHTIADDEISENLSAFARRRTDIFGDNTDIQIRSEKEDKIPDNKVIWDGHAGSIQRVTAAAAVPVTLPVLAPPPPTRLPMHVPPMPPGMISQIPPMPPVVGVPQPPPGMAVMGGGYPDMTGVQQQIDYGMVPPPPPGEPQSKRAKVDEVTSHLQPEDVFLKSVPGGSNGNYTVFVTVPNDNSKPEWKLNGQRLTIQVTPLSTVATFKEQIKTLVGLPANKQKLSTQGLPHLVDQKSLAFYNLGPEANVELRVKARGGR